MVQGQSEDVSQETNEAQQSHHNSPLNADGLIIGGMSRSDRVTNDEPEKQLKRIIFKVIGYLPWLIPLLFIIYHSSLFAPQPSALSARKPIENVPPPPPKELPRAFIQ